LNLQVRTYREGDDNNIVELLKESFNGWPFFDINCSPINYWRWKYQDNPNGKGIIVCAETENKIVGISTAVPQKIKIKNDVYLGFYATDAAVHPDYRRMGINNKMRELREKLWTKANAKFVYGITVNPIVVNSSVIKKIFPHHLTQRINYPIRIKNISIQLQQKEIVNRLKTRLWFYKEKTINRIKTLKIGSREVGNLQISDIKEFDERWKEFWSKVRTNYFFIFERSNSYLNWRYCDKRSGDYKVRIIEEDNKILGYSVLKINKLEEYQKGYIVDFLTLPDRLDAAYFLVIDTIDYFDDMGINQIDFQVIKEHPYNEIFLKHGFINTEGPRWVYYDIFIDGFDLNSIQGSQIHFAYGDQYGI